MPESEGSTSLDPEAPRPDPARTLAAAGRQSSLDDIAGLNAVGSFPKRGTTVSSASTTRAASRAACQLTQVVNVLGHS